MTLRKLISTAALSIAALGISNAATITFNAQQGPQLTDFNFNLVLGKFDTNLGTLTGATIKFTGTDDVVSLTLTNNSNSSQTFRYTSNVDFLVTGNTSGDSTLVGTDLASPIFTTGGFVTLGPAGSGACPAATPSAACNSVSYLPPPVSVNTGDVAIASLGFYQQAGVGTFSLTGSTLTGSTFTGGGGNVASNQVTNGTALATITYTYTPATTGTPEPATMAVMGVSLLGLAMIRRKK